MVDNRTEEEKQVPKELLIFSWEGNKINGFPFPTRNLLMGRGLKAMRHAGAFENQKNHAKNEKRFGQSRKSWRRALKLARGTMNEKHIVALLKRVKLDA